MKKTGRNVPCPCRSGEDYERCCGRALKAESEERNFYNSVEYHQRLAVVNALNGEKTLEKIGEISDHAAGHTDSLVEDLKSRWPSPLPVACNAGCAWCCHLPVEITPPEAIRIAGHLREALSAEGFANVKNRVAELDGRTRGMGTQERLEARLPCALLVHGLCSIYPVRPLKCRGANSVDAGKCERYYGTGESGLLPIYVPQIQAADRVQAGLASGLSYAGLDPERLELTAALHIALEDPNVAERWLAGEPVFAPARISE